MTNIEKIKELLYPYDRITPSEIAELFKNKFSVDDLIKMGVIVPTNYYFEGERFYDVHRDYYPPEKYPLSDIKYQNLSYSFNLPLRIEKIIYNWAVRNNLDINRFKKAWNSDLRDKTNDLFTNFLGKSEKEIIKTLNAEKNKIIAALSKSTGKHGTYLPVYQRLSLESFIDQAKVTSKISPELSNRISITKRNLICSVFEYNDVKSILPLLKGV